MSSSVCRSRNNVTIERLPIELRQGIMMFLPDLKSLAAMAISCSAFYDAFCEAEVHIVSHVFNVEMDIDLLPEAVAVLESSHTRWARDSLLHFNEKHLMSREYHERFWYMSDATSVIRLYHLIHQLAIDFASQSLIAYGEVDSPTKEELNRFERAFYRYQLYCNLYGDLMNPILSVQDQSSEFLHMFSYWENEQLACVRDYLFRLIAPCKSYP